LDQIVKNEKEIEGNQGIEKLDNLEKDEDYIREN